MCIFYVLQIPDRLSTRCFNAPKGPEPVFGLFKLALDTISSKFSMLLIGFGVASVNLPKKQKQKLLLFSHSKLS